MRQTLLNQEKFLYEEIEAYKKSWSKENFYDSKLKPRINQFNRLCLNEKNWWFDEKSKLSKNGLAQIDSNSLISCSCKAPMYSHSWGNCAIEYIVGGFGTLLLPMAGEIILLGALARDAYYIDWEKPVFPPSRGAVVTYHPEYIPEKTAYLDYLSRYAKMYLGCVNNNRNVSSFARVKCYSEF